MIPCEQWGPEKGVRFTRAGVKDICEPPCVCWESSPGPLGEKLVLLTTEPPLQPTMVLYRALQ